MIFCFILANTLIQALPEEPLMSNAELLSRTVRFELADENEMQERLCNSGYAQLDNISGLSATACGRPLLIASAQILISDAIQDYEVETNVHGNFNIYNILRLLFEEHEEPQAIIQELEQEANRRLEGLLWEANGI